MNVVKELEQNERIEDILKTADVYHLRAEVRATAMAIVRDDPKITTGSAYEMAAYEWDIGWV